VSGGSQGHCCSCRGGRLLGDPSPCSPDCEGTYCTSCATAYVKLDASGIVYPPPITPSTPGVCRICREPLPPRRTKRGGRNRKYHAGRCAKRASKGFKSL
jgi:hypothetical protein